MILSVSYSMIIIIVIAAITFALRATPFILFSKSGTTPNVITYLGNALPPAVMGMLIIYCLKNTDVFNMPFGASEFIAVLSVVLLHLWRKNNLLSILGGTVIYMFLVQVVFA